MTTTHLQLQEQLCFPMYATSRMITRMYQPWLEKLGITYPQYLVMLVLWEEDNIKLSNLCKSLYLNTNTLTPLVKKLIDKDLVTKTRSDKDEREIRIELTERGNKLRMEAEEIPFKIAESVKMPVEELIQMKALMWKFLDTFN